MSFTFNASSADTPVSWTSVTTGTPFKPVEWSGMHLTNPVNLDFELFKNLNFFDFTSIQLDLFIEKLNSTEGFWVGIQFVEVKENSVTPDYPWSGVTLQFPLTGIFTFFWMMGTGVNYDSGCKMKVGCFNLKIGET